MTVSSPLTLNRRRRRSPLAILSAAAAAFAPTDLAGLALWLDADDASSFTFSSGSVVSQWNDKSGNARHASQGTVANQPSRSGSINSLASVVFDGTNDYLECANPTNMITSGPWTAFAVFKSSSVVGDRGIVDSDSSRRLAQFLRTSGTAAQAIGFNTGGTPFVDATGVTVATGTPYQLTGRIDATALETWLDNSSNGTTAVTGTLQTSNASSKVPIGASLASTATTFLAFFAGDIAEVVLYNAALSTTDRQAVQTYLRTKWGTA